MNLLHQKYNAAYRYFMWQLFSKKLDLIQIVEYPKSGGTWVTQLVSEYLGIYYPRNVVPKFKKSVIHGHYLYSKRFNKIIFVVRDGRDIMVSYYFHYLIGNDRIPQRIIKDNRSKFKFTDYENIQKNLPEFIKYLHTDYLKKINRFSWSELIESYSVETDNITFVKYEDLLKDPSEELKKILLYLGEKEIDNDKLEQTVNKYSFKTQTKRKPGEEDKSSFLRKGIAGDWRNHFTKESAQVFDQYAGKMLIKLGYEKDNNWVNDL